VLYLTVQLGFSAERAAFVLALYGIVSLFAGPLAGRLADRWGGVRVMQVSLVTSGFVLLFFPLAESWPAVLIMTALLLSHPHSYSDALRRLEKPLAPRDVKRAVEYIEAHLDEAISVADLVRVTGVAGRTLFMHFQTFKGVSPMRYLRNARLRKVRQVLGRAGPEANVTEVAMSLGFTHMGRFSVAYRMHFGESPSQTLKSRKQAHQLASKPNHRSR